MAESTQEFRDGVHVAALVGASVNRTPRRFPMPIDMNILASILHAEREGPDRRKQGGTP